MIRLCLILLVLTLSSLTLPPLRAAAQSPTSTPQIEESARKVGRALRCVVCQNQSIDESDAPLATDMRRIVRERLSAGESEADVIAYMRESYGDYVLLKPPVQSNTVLLWGLPFILLLAGLVWFFKPAKRKPLSEKQNSTETPIPNSLDKER